MATRRTTRRRTYSCTRTGIGRLLSILTLSFSSTETSESCDFLRSKKLFGLLKQSRLIETCWDPEDPDFNWHERGLKNEDRWIPLMSLAPLLHTKQEIECFNSPYLQAERESIRRWDKILKLSHQQPLIGLHWQGNPEHEMTLSRGRSIALRQLELLLDVEGAQWLSLQKGPGSDQLDSLQWRDRFHPKQSLVDDCWDFRKPQAS